LWISRKKICKDLAKHGCIPNKSKFITFPFLNSRSFDLAFLLGYYDGDGKTQSTIITTGSKQFLEDIKKLFDLPFKLRTERRITFHDHRKRSSNSETYELSLGAELFNEMMDNYADSLPSKRKHYSNLRRRNSRLDKK